MACTLFLWMLVLFCHIFRGYSMGHSWSQGRGYKSRGRYWVRVMVISGSHSWWGSLSIKVGSLSCLDSVVGVGWVCEFATFASSREMVVHGTHRFLHSRMNSGVQMLCNVAFRECPRIEDVAKLVFWVGTILVLGLGLGCHLDWGLVAHLAGCLVMVLRLGHLWVFFCVLTFWLWRYWNVVWRGGFRGFPPLWPVGPISARVAFLRCVAFLSTSFARVSYLVRHSVASVPCFAGRFSAVLDNVSGMAAPETRTCWFRWVGGFLLFLGINLMFSRYVIVDGV